MRQLPICWRGLCLRSTCREDCRRQTAGPQQSYPRCRCSYRSHQHLILEG
ncbi:hypothetical protein EVA_09528 [gut metagenome]|uniref:Uncharacterized protein n=1 Tax=gut metagenome TaxID=749906 RepID=J9G560_9ZZZZ